MVRKSRKALFSSFRNSRARLKFPSKKIFFLSLLMKTHSSVDFRVFEASFDLSGLSARNFRASTWRHQVNIRSDGVTSQNNVFLPNQRERRGKQSKPKWGKSWIMMKIIAALHIDRNLTYRTVYFRSHKLVTENVRDPDAVDHVCEFLLLLKRLIAHRRG
jgi:hypothetical protein